MRVASFPQAVPGFAQSLCPGLRALGFQGAGCGG